MILRDPIESVKGVGPKLRDTLAGLAIHTIEDMLQYYPRSYIDYSSPVAIHQLHPGLVTLKVKFKNIMHRRVSRGLSVTSADAYDDTGAVRVVWFNQPYRSAQLHNELYILKGEYAFKNKRLQIVNPSVELNQELTTDTAIVSVYPERNGLRNHQVRSIINEIISSGIDMPQTIPPHILRDYALMPEEYAWKSIHAPKSSIEIEQAQRTFAFIELYIVLMAAASLKQSHAKAKAMQVPFNEVAAKTFVKELPYSLTNAQRKAVWQIYKDMAKNSPMNRLLEGDVGSGKTVVAAMAALMVLYNNMQVAFIAPTEILASQHFASLKKMLAHTPYKNYVILLTGSLAKKEKDALKKRLLHKSPCLVIGTHALFQQDVEWSLLGLAIIDEQHRFGVQQRQTLHTQSPTMPHILCMTATPIPRSLALTVYGELELSILDEVPVHKQPIQTVIVSPNSTNQMYNNIKVRLKAGRQAYIVCPLIEESDTLNTASAQQTYEQLRTHELKDYRVGLLHGKLKAAEKEVVMHNFLQRKIDVLVATTVIEVGVDVPNATDIVILGADRFGLAQLHQLRGRVGRGVHKSYCHLVMSTSFKPSARMQAIASTNNGFQLAEYDLELRGPGAIYGTLQHGALDLRFASLTDHLLISQAQSAVAAFMHHAEDMIKYPRLAQKVQKALRLTYLN